jgi:hypothetical protein
MRKHRSRIRFHGAEKEGSKTQSDMVEAAATASLILAAETRMLGMISETGVPIDASTN